MSFHTITFGNVAENGPKLFPCSLPTTQTSGFTRMELETAKTAFEADGAVCELIDLRQEGIISSDDKTYDSACVLVVRKGAGLLASIDKDEMVYQRASTPAPPPVIDSWALSDDEDDGAVVIPILRPPPRTNSGFDTKANDAHSEMIDYNQPRRRKANSYMSGDYFEHGENGSACGLVAGVVKDEMTDQHWQEQTNKLETEQKLLDYGLENKIDQFSNHPTLNIVREKLPTYLGDQARHLYAELDANHRLDRGIDSFYSDPLRLVKIGIRLGYSKPLRFHWYHESYQIGTPITIELEHGDLYVMGRDAVGSGWPRRNVPTLRHTAYKGSYDTSYVV